MSLRLLNSFNNIWKPENYHGFNQRNSFFEGWYYKIVTQDSKYKFALIDNNIIVMSNINNQIQFRPPSGEKNKDLFDQVFTLAKKQDSEYPFGVIDSSTKDWLSRNYPILEFTPKREYFDYV